MQALNLLLINQLHLILLIRVKNNKFNLYLYSFFLNLEVN